MATRLNLDRLNDKARDLFYARADVVYRLDRGPDLQWYINGDGKFEVWTTEEMTPGRTQHCLPVLKHKESVLQSVWLCESTHQQTKKVYCEHCEDFLYSIVNFCHFTFAKMSMDKSNAQTRRYPSFGSLLILSIGGESFCTKIPDHLVHSFAAAQTETEENVTYLSHFINTV